jgi:hypothetical protein
MLVDHEGRRSQFETAIEAAIFTHQNLVWCRDPVANLP